MSLIKALSSAKIVPMVHRMPKRYNPSTIKFDIVVLNADENESLPTIQYIDPGIRILAASFLLCSQQAVTIVARHLLVSFAAFIEVHTDEKAVERQSHEDQNLFKITCE